MIHCTQCGAELADGTKFCTSCGEKVQQQPGCPKCGAAMPAGTKFCTECGASMDAAAPAPQPPAPAEEENQTVSLSKGQTVSLSKKKPGLQKLLIGLGWDVNESGGPDCDLDGCAFLLGENNKCPKETDFVFYGNQEHASGALKHLGDNLTGSGEGDDEQIVIDLGKMPANIVRIAFTVTIHEAEERGQNFSQVSNSFIRVEDSASGKELVRFELTESFATETAVVVGELVRSGSEWQFNAVGKGFQGGLAALCGNYGIQVE